MSGYTRLRALTRVLIAPFTAALALAATAGATPPTAPVVNGSFELGNLSGWTTVIPPGGFINVVGGGAPGGGSSFANMKTDGPGSFTTLSQTIAASAGDTIHGYARFNDAEGGSCFFNDQSFVEIKQGATVIATPFGGSSCATGSTGWVAWSYAVTADGAYTVQARIANAIDSIVDSTLDLDAVALTKPLRNGSFEDGNTGGWASVVPPGGFIVVSGGGAPGGGSAYARMKTDGPGSYTTLSQAVTLAAGEALTGAAKFNDAEGGSCFFNDNAQVDVLGSGTLLGFSSCGTGSTGWTNFAFVAPAAGTYTLQFRIANAIDSIVDSTLDVDGVSVDKDPPTLSLPADITAEATSPAGAAVSYTATAADDSDLGPSLACSPAPGSTFPLGTTTVGCTATDLAGRTTSGSFNVKVVDTTPPSLTVPANMTIEATGPGGAVATFAASATDIVDPSPAVSCSPASGSTFAIGTTTVSCTATDASGNSSSASFLVKVQDTTAPAVSCALGVNPDGGSPNANAGFRKASGTDAVGVVSLTFTSGAFSWSYAGSSANVKLTQAPGNAGKAEPGEGLVLAHLIGPADFTVTAADAAGNSSTIACAPVPPKNK